MNVCAIDFLLQYAIHFLKKNNSERSCAANNSYIITTHIRQFALKFALTQVKTPKSNNFP